MTDPFYCVVPTTQALQWMPQNHKGRRPSKNPKRRSEDEMCQRVLSTVSYHII